MPQKSKCEVCGKPKRLLSSAVVRGVYYARICARCLSGNVAPTSSTAASYERRRGYEDMAQDTVQPYDAGGQPNLEFFRLYPQQAAKIYSADTINELRRKL